MIKKLGNGSPCQHQIDSIEFGSIQIFFNYDSFTVLNLKKNCLITLRYRTSFENVQAALLFHLSHLLALIVIKIKIS